MSPVFIETGTLHGDGIQTALKAGFNKIYSIEIDPELYSKCVKRFTKQINDGKVEIILGDSEEQLGNIIDKVNQPITFWLDAHNMPHNREKDAERSKSGTPLYRELELISKHPIKNHTLMIDDIRLIKDQEAWGGHNVTVEELKGKIEQINYNYNFVYEDGAIKKDVFVAFMRKNNSFLVWLDEIKIPIKKLTRKIRSKIRSKLSHKNK